MPEAFETHHLLAVGFALQTGGLCDFRPAFKVSQNAISRLANALLPQEAVELREDGILSDARPVR